MSAAARCEECGTFDVVVEVNPRTSLEPGLPENWLRVFAVDNEGRMGDDRILAYKVDGQFCSFGCASKFLAKKGAARG